MAIPAAAVAGKVALGGAIAYNVCTAGGAIAKNLQRAQREAQKTGKALNRLAQQVAKQQYGKIPNTAFQAVSGALVATDNLINAAQTGGQLAGKIVSGSAAAMAAPIRPDRTKRVSGYVTRTGRQVRQYYRAMKDPMGAGVKLAARAISKGKW
jgi:hypothetical protein